MRDSTWWNDKKVRWFSVAYAATCHFLPDLDRRAQRSGPTPAPRYKPQPVGTEQADTGCVAKSDESYNPLLGCLLYQHHNPPGQELIPRYHLYPCGEPDAAMVEAALPMIEDRLMRGREEEKPAAAS